MSAERDDPLGAAALIADVRRIAALGPRSCATPGDARIRALLADDLRRIGAQRVREQPLPVLAHRPIAAACTVDGTALPARGIDGTAAASATGPGRFVGDGGNEAIADAVRRDGPLAGAVVVVRSDLLFPVAARLLPHDVAALVHVGSAPDGLIGAFTATFHPAPSGPEWPGRVLPFPGVSVPTDAGERLITGLAAATTPITVVHEARYEAATTANVIAEIPGTGDERIVVGAHHDSQYDSPGASDNATGLAALLAIARRWSPVRRDRGRPQRTIELVAFAGEEPGCWGSQHHARACDRDRTVAMVNLDALGPPLDATRTVIATPELRALAIAAAASTGWRADAEVSAAEFPYGDHAPYVDAGIPACLLWRWPPPHPYYHTPGDTPEHVDPVRLAEDAVAIAAVVERLAG